eukprot:1881308-Amphidinium_carterae.1
MKLPWIDFYVSSEAAFINTRTFYCLLERDGALWQGAGSNHLHGQPNILAMPCQCFDTPGISVGDTMMGVACSGSATCLCRPLEHRQLKFWLRLELTKSCLPTERKCCIKLGLSVTTESLAAACSHVDYLCWESTVSGSVQTDPPGQARVSAPLKGTQLRQNPSFKRCTGAKPATR